MIQAVRVRVSVVRDVVRVRVHQIYVVHLTHPNRAASLNSLGTADGTASRKVGAQGSLFSSVVSGVVPFGVFAFMGTVSEYLVLAS